MHLKTNYTLRFCLLLIVGFLLVSTSVNCANPVRILFIGNSYTYAGSRETDPGLPRFIKEMAVFYGHDIQNYFVLKGGAMLEQHWNDGKALDLIKARHNYNFTRQCPVLMFKGLQP